jgi:hypothetical protein
MKQSGYWEYKKENDACCPTEMPMAILLRQSASCKSLKMFLSLELKVVRDNLALNCYVIENIPVTVIL